MGSESRTLVPPNRTNRPSPGSFDWVVPQSRCAFGCPRRNRSGRPETPAQRKERTSRVLVGRFWAPACRRLGLSSRSWVRSGAWVWYLQFRSVWCDLRCLRKSVTDACHPVIAISVVPKLGTTQAVWMPGLWRCPGTVRASGDRSGQRFTSRIPSSPPPNKFEGSSWPEVGW